jgi:hypothetical protein
MVDRILLKLTRANFSPVVCLDEPVDESIHFIREVYRRRMEDSYVITSLDDSRIKEHMNSHGAAGLDGKIYNSYTEALQGLTQFEIELAIEEFQDHFRGLVIAAPTTLDLLNKINSNYCGMGLPRYERKAYEAQEGFTVVEKYKYRQTHMVEQLYNQCNKIDDYVIGLLGASHFDVAAKLRDLGKEVKDYYIAEYVPSREVYDVCTRVDPDNEICKDYAPFQGTVYEFHNAITKQDAYEKIFYETYNEIIDQIITEENTVACGLTCKIMKFFEYYLQ